MPKRNLDSGERPEDYWLREKLIKTLRYAIKREENYPNRPTLYDRLEEIEKAARLLIDELEDLQITALLFDGDEDPENTRKVYHGLCDIAARAARVPARRPRTKGRGRLYPEADIGPNPMELCALMVSIYWHEKRRQWPGNDTLEVHQACELLWRNADGPARPAWGKPDSLVTWRNHLRAAQKYRPPHPAGQHIQRILAGGGSLSDHTDGKRFE